MGTFIKKPVPVEAVRFTGDNWAEVHAFTGHHDIGHGPFDVFQENKGEWPDSPDPDLCPAVLWVQANGAWLGIEPGEWIMHDKYGFYPCKGNETAPDNYEEIK